MATKRHTKPTAPTQEAKAHYAQQPEQLLSHGALLARFSTLLNGASDDEFEFIVKLLRDWPNCFNAMEWTFMAAARELGYTWLGAEIEDRHNGTELETLRRLNTALIENKWPGAFLRSLLDMHAKGQFTTPEDVFLALSGEIEARDTRKNHAVQVLREQPGLLRAEILNAVQEHPELLKGGA